MWERSGIYSLAALAMQPVHAFEPAPEIAAPLRATAKLKGLDHLPVHEAADKYGQAILRLFRGEPGTNEGMNFVSRDLDDSGAEHVETVCVDQFARIIRLTMSIL